MELDDQPVLPDEIFSLIFTFLEHNDWTDRPTLLAFSLVSRRFRHWCQGLAIRRLYLTTEDEETLIPILEKTTAMNASIGPSVQSLDLTFHTPEMKGPIAKFLSRLTGIKSLHISIDSWDFEFLEDWSSIPEPIRVELARIMTSPQLSALQILSMTFPLAQLLNYGSALTNLRHLDIFAIDNSLEPVEEFKVTLASDATITPISVRKLTICAGDGKPLLESNRFDWESVRTLELTRREPLFPHSGDELNECRDMLARMKNLTRLQTKKYSSIHGQFDTLFSSVNAEFCSSLSHIDVSLDWSRPRWRVGASGVGELESARGRGECDWGFDHREEPYMGLFTALSTFPSKSALETIRVSLYLPFRDEASVATAFDSTHWTRISSILTPERFPSLTLVYVGVCMPPPSGRRPSVKAVRDELQRMPWGHLRESGKLELEVFRAWMY